MRPVPMKSSEYLQNDRPKVSEETGKASCQGIGPDAMSKAQARKGCLITGVAGFVGSHLADRLLSLDFEVVGVDNFFSGHRENMASFIDHPNFYFHEYSINQPYLLAALLKLHPRLSYCFHLAAIVSVPYSMDHPEETMDINYRATASLVQEADKLRFDSFLFAGSAAEYGNDQRLPLEEKYASEHTEHLSPYGRAKFYASRSVAEMPFGVALRFFNIYGPRQDPASPYSGVISRFIEMALSGKPLTIFGDGLQTRDFVYVSDVVEAYLHAAGITGKVSLPFNGIYNVGTGKAATVLDLAKTILKLTGQPVDSLTFLCERAGDIRHSLAAVECFQTESGWRPQISLHDGLHSTTQWARQIAR